MRAAENARVHAVKGAGRRGEIDGESISKMPQNSAAAALTGRRTTLPNTLFGGVKSMCNR